MNTVSKMYVIEVVNDLSLSISRQLEINEIKLKTLNIKIELIERGLSGYIIDKISDTSCSIKETKEQLKKIEKQIEQINKHIN